MYKRSQGINAFCVLQWLLTSSSSLGANLKGFCYERAGASCHFVVGDGIVSMSPLCKGNKGNHLKWNEPISQRRVVTLGSFYHTYFSHQWWQASGSNSLSSAYKGKQLPRAWSLTCSQLYCAYSPGLPSCWHFNSEKSERQTTWHPFWSPAPGRYTLSRTSDLSSFIIFHQSWKYPFCYQPKLSKQVMFFFALAETATSLYVCVLEHVDPWDLQGCIPGRSCLTSFSALLPFVKTKCCIKPLGSKQGLRWSL